MDSQESPYPGPIRLGCIILSLALAVFLYGLDSTILATAIPKITDQFNALGDVGWYAAAYLFTSSSFQLLFGRMYTIFSVQKVYLSAVALFELGSLVCATAPSSAAFIVGRAIAGVGSAGLFSGAIVILAYSVPVNKRPRYTGLLGASFGISSIIGPFLGGAFADSVTWRWCFYINLPLGAITFVVVLLYVGAHRDPKYQSMSWTQLVKQLDIPGIVTLVPAIICLLLPLQWGGSTYAWTNARVITLLILFGLLSIVFIVVQRVTPKTRTIPGSIFKSRSIRFTTWYAFCTFATYVVMVYYLPLWFQGVQQVSALNSGIRTLPLILGFIVCTVMSGILTEVVGYYVPMMILSSILTPVAIGLLSTFHPSTPSSQWIGYQALLGFGIGFGIQCSLLVIQTVLPKPDIPVGTALITLTQSLSGAIFVSIARNVFINQLGENTKELKIPNINTQMLVSGGATTLVSSIPPDKRQAFLEAYSKSITQTFYIGAALAALGMIGTLGTEWKSVKKNKAENVQESGEGWQESELNVTERKDEGAENTEATH